MPTTFANTINGNEILAKRSQCDYGGNDIQLTYATITGVNSALANKEDSSNKAQTLDPSSTTDFPSSSATANYVNSSVATATATFLGNFTLTELGLTYPATDAQIGTALDSYTWPVGSMPTNNDYVYVEIQDPQTTGIDDRVERFKYDGSNWLYEYTLNNSSFTSQEKAAIDSGIDSTKVTTYDTHVADTDIHVTLSDKSTWTAKQDAISDLATIRSGAALGATAVQPGDLATVATTGDYDDLVDKPDLSIYAESSNLATVATSGDYDDLLNKPTIPAAQVQSDWTEADNTEPSYIQNKPSLATVATSGDYDDLLNKPSIPAAQVQSNWTEADNTDPSYIQNKPTLATVATSGLYSDLSGTPSLATVATSGDYDDLLNKPTIPSGSDLVPPYSIPADEGKVLTVGPSTTYWATPAAGGVTDVEVDGTSVVSQGVASITMPTVDQTYDGTSTNAQSGTAIAGEIANLAQVPSVTSSDDGKVLTADYTGGVASYSWETPSSTWSGLFEAEYNVTSYADIRQAITNKQIVYCKVPQSGTAVRMAFLAYIGSSTIEFQYYRSVSSKSATNQGDEVYVYTVNSSSTWSTTTRNCYTRITAGTNMSQSYSNGVLTLYASDQLPQSTSSDEGKVLTVDSNGDPQWATGGGGGGVTDVEVDGTSVVSGGVASITMPTVDQTYDGTSTNAQSGIAIAGELATINQVPASTSSDSGKVLTVDAQGIPGWVTGGGGGGVQSDWTEADPTSMAYIENKPTPKTLTAGDNVTITETSSTITVSASWQNDEVVLYSGMQTIGSDGAATYNLSELPTNFQYIRIYYCASDNTFSSTINGNVGVGSTEWDTTIYTAPNTSVWLLMNGSGVLNTMTAYNIQANLHNIRTASWSVNGFLNAATGNAKWFHIYKIVGIHRIAND